MILSFIGCDFYSARRDPHLGRILNTTRQFYFQMACEVTQPEVGTYHGALVRLLFPLDLKKGLFAGIFPVEGS